MIKEYKAAFDMVNKWLNDGEVSGTDHYIGKDYDKEEYTNLRIIRELLYRHIRFQEIMDDCFITLEKEEEE